MPVSISVVNKSPHPLPEYQTTDSAGVDLRAWLQEPLTLKPLERRLIPTGIYLSLPEGFEAQIRPRSGLAIKQGITLINTPGTIDADYRGEIMLPVVNLSSEEQKINDGDRIAQMVFARYEKITWALVDSLSETSRGSGGFGHSGIQ